MIVDKNYKKNLHLVSLNNLRLSQRVNLIFLGLDYDKQLQLTLSWNRSDLAKKVVLLKPDPWKVLDTEKTSYSKFLLTELLCQL